MNDTARLETMNELNAIAQTLSRGNQFEIEVLWSAMNYLRTNPAATIEEACNFGMSVWFK